MDSFNYLSLLVCFLITLILIYLLIKQYPSLNKKNIFASFTENVINKRKFL